MLRRLARSAYGMMLLVQLHSSWSATLTFETLQLPELRVQGQAAKAHTQGLEVVDGDFYVTARRDDITPKRALLLRTSPGRADWDVWDITPVDERGAVTSLDHPGGMQSDGQRLWIPLSESKRNGRSLVRVFPIAHLVAGQAVRASFEFPVNDHIGAVAIAAERRQVLGASWDTESVYVWDFAGRLQRNLRADELAPRGLGVISGAQGRAGLAVQDWKIRGDRLWASGLFRGPGPAAAGPQSRLMSFTGFLESAIRRSSVSLPMQDGIELGREAMAIVGDRVFFLPEDLGRSNRVFRAAISELVN